MPGGLDKDGPALRADTRVYHHHMDGLWRKPAVRLRNQERALGDIERPHFVCNVDDPRRRTDSENDSLHDAGEMIRRPEVRSESDDRL